MLKPEYLDALPDSLIELYSQVEQDILADMARRISQYNYWIPAVEHQRQKLREMGLSQKHIIRVLSQISGKSQGEIKRLMQQACDKALESDRDYYRQYGFDAPSAKSAEMKAILNAGLKSTNALFKNLTKTTASAGQEQFVNALDKAWLQINSSAFDYNTAIRNAIKDLARQGLHAVRYASGRADTLEVAVRRAIVTGVNQTAGQMQWQLADELGCDLVETTAHAGARPEHAVWQGKIYSRSGKSKKYPDFRSLTGYGTGAGLLGWNCRHNFNPYVEGSPRAYSDELLQEYNAKKYEYNGKKLTEYEASQMQRYHERQIRRWKRENVAMQAAGQDTTESAIKIRSWQERQKDFIRQTGLKRQSDREQIAGFGKSQARKATQQAKTIESKANKLYNLGNTEANVETYLRHKSVHDELESHDIQFVQWISEKEVVVNAGKPKITGETKHAADNRALKSDRAGMTIEKAQSFVDNAKITVYQPDRNNLKFLAQDGYTILNFDNVLVTAVPQKWRRKYDKYLEADEE